MNPAQRSPLDADCVMAWLSEDPRNADAFIELVRRRAAEKSAEWLHTRKQSAVLQ